MRECNITHIVAASSSQVVPEDMEGRPLHVVRMIDQKGKLLFSLPDCVRFIRIAIAEGGRVLVHSPVVSTAAVIICAYCKSHVTYHDSLRCLQST